MTYSARNVLLFASALSVSAYLIVKFAYPSTQTSKRLARSPRYDNLANLPYETLYKQLALQVSQSCHLSSAEIAQLANINNRNSLCNQSLYDRFFATSLSLGDRTAPRKVSDLISHIDKQIDSFEHSATSTDEILLKGSRLLQSRIHPLSNLINKKSKLNLDFLFREIDEKKIHLSRQYDSKLVQKVISDLKSAIVTNTTHVRNMHLKNINLLEKKLSYKLSKYKPGHQQFGDRPGDLPTIPENDSKTP